MLLLYLFSLVLFGVVHAQVRYSVISPGNMGVVIDGNDPLPLNPAPSSSILHSGTGPKAKKSYYYVKMNDGDEITDRESFEREPTEKSLNEFFNITWNTKHVRQLPQLYSPMPYIHRIRSDLHAIDQIPTFHFTADQSELDNMHNNVKEEIKVMTNLTYIRVDGAKTLSQVNIKIGGRNARRYPKLSYNLKLNKGDLYGFTRLKLRALGTTDPAYIREDLSYKTLVSMGVSTTYSSFARVFFNDRPMGIYGLIEHYKPSWLENEFADGNKQYQHGFLYQGARRTPESDAHNHKSDLSYYDGNDAMYEDGQYRIKEEPTGQKLGYKPLIDFTKFIRDAPNDAKIWEKHFDVEGFIRNMVAEFYLGFSDGFWVNLNNYFLYQEPETGRMIYIPSDTNRALGNSQYEMEKMLTGNMTEFATMADKSPVSYRLFGIPEFEKRFQQVSRDVVSKIFNMKAMGPVIDDTVAMIQEDVAWDQTLDFPGELNMPHERKEGEPINVRNTDTAYDCWVVARDGIPFKKAVYGPVTGHLSTIGVEEWIKKKVEAVKAF